MWAQLSETLKAPITLIISPLLSTKIIETNIDFTQVVIGRATMIVNPYRWRATCAVLRSSAYERSNLDGSSRGALSICWGWAQCQGNRAPSPAHTHDTRTIVDSQCYRTGAEYVLLFGDIEDRMRVPRLSMWSADIVCRRSLVMRLFVWDGDGISKFLYADLQLTIDNYYVNNILQRTSNISGQASRL